VSLKVGVFLIFLIKALRSISKKMIFLFLFLGNFSMGVQTYSHHCILDFDFLVAVIEFSLNRQMQITVQKKTKKNNTLVNVLFFCKFK